MKKRKLLLSTFMSLAFVFFGMLMVGCGENPVDIEIVSGIPVVVANSENKQPDWSKVKAKVLFEDGTERTVDYTKLIFGEVDTTTAGIKDVSVKYTSGEFQITIKLTVIDSKSINAEISAYSGTYDGLSHNAVEITGLRAGDTVLYSTDNQETWSNTMPKFKNAGEYKVSVKISREYRDDQIEEKTVTISKKQLEVKAEDKHITYGDTMPSFTYTVEGFVEDETETVLKKLPQVSCAGTNAGTYDIEVSGAEADNYSFNYIKGSLVIDKATYNMSNVEWNYTSAFTYDGTEKSVALKNLPSGVTATYTNNQKTNAGTYIASVANFDYDKTNFNEPILPQGVQNTCEWIINRAQNTTTYSVTGYTGVYDGEAHTFSFSGTTDETVEYSTDNTNWQTIRPSLTDVGSLTVYIKITKDNYEPKRLQTFITINKRSNMGITANGYEGLYTGENYQVVLNGTESGDIIKYSLDNKTTWQDENPSYKDATDGIVTVYVKITRETYEDEILPVQFSINRVQLTVKADDKTVKYGEQVSEFSATYTGFVNGEDKNVLSKLPLLACEYQVGANAGSTFDIVASGAEAKNYTFVYQKGTLTVEKAEVAKPTKNASTFIYNGQDQTYLPNGYDDNKMIISGNVQKDANPDAYQVKVTPNSNYVWADTKDSQEITFNFMIEQKVAELSWATTNLYYNGKSQTPVCVVSNLINGDVCEVVVEGGMINVGENYTATAKSLGNSNYKLPTVNVTCEFNILVATNRWIVEPSIKITSSGVKYSGEALFGNATVIKKFKKVTDSDDSYSETMPTEDGEYNMMVTIPKTDNYTELNTVVKFYISNVEIESMASPLLTRNTDNFIHKSNNLVAGADNYYDLQLIGTTSSFVEIQEFSADIELYVKQNDNTYSKLTGNDLTEFATIDEFKHHISFTNSAIGKTVKIVVTKEGVSSAIEYIVDVVSGYNVYTAKDLCVIENKGIHDWDKFKQGTKYENVTTNAVVIQKDIKVKDSDIPAEFFYTEAEASAVPAGKTNQTIVGTMKDGDGNGTGGNERGIYHRGIKSGETFAFYGNYFNIDYSELTKCVVQSGHKAGVIINDEDTSKETLITTHVTFLKFEGVGKTSNINFKDVSFIGNAQRNARSANSGGAILAKFDGLNSNINNSIYKNCFIGFMFDGGDTNNVETTNVLTDSKGYDSYNTLIYVYGINNLLIEGGEYARAGGPVMIVDHVGNDQSTGDGGYPSNINIIGSKLESLVTGNEPWFVSYGATALIPQVTALNAAYNDFGTSYLVTDGKIQNLMNLKVVYKSSSVEGVAASVVRGGVKYFNNQEEYENNTGYGLDMTTYSKQASSDGANKLQNSVNGTFFGSTTYLIVESGSNKYIVKLANATKLLGGDQTVVEGQLIENKIYWSDDRSPIDLPTTSNMQLTEDLACPAFVVNEPNNTYGLRAESGVTNINFYLFNGMGIMLELYPKGHTVS